MLTRCLVIIWITCVFLSSCSIDVDSLKKNLDIYNANIGDISRCVDKSLSESLQVGESLCLGENVILPNSSIKGLVGYWSFDKLYSIDESGNGNHITTPVTYGPPSNGQGSSSSFVDDATSYRIRATNSLDLYSFTITFKIYLLGDYSTTFRNIISRLSYNSNGPTILLYPQNNRLSIRIPTTVSDVEGLSSNSAIPIKRWTQISVVVTDGSLKIYINGMLDSSIGLNGSLIKSSGDLIMGKKFKIPGFRGYLDELRIYDYAMGHHEIAAFVSNSLTGFYHSFKIQLGCTYCSFKDATSYGFCPFGFKLCTLDQLYIAGAHVARVNGWLYSSNQIWHKGITNDYEYRAAMCCKS